MSSSSACNRSGSSARISSRSRTDGERGYALIAVVGIVGVLAVIAMALTERARIGASAASEFVEETRDLYAVQAGIALAERTLAGKPDLGKEGELRLELTWDDRHVDILIIDQARKIAVNRASLQQLADGFLSIGFTRDDALTLAARTIDWRDPDDRPLPRGAEADDYLATGLLTVPRNDRFVSLDEIGTILGMTPDASGELHEQFWVGREISSTAAAPGRALTVPGLTRQISEAAPSDGLTRSADVNQGANEIEFELRVHRDREWMVKVYLRPHI